MNGVVATKWGYKCLGELTDKIGSGATPRGGKDSYKESGISLIRSLNIHDLEFRYANLARIDDAQAAALANVDVEARDVLLNITGASIARCAQVPQDVLPARVNQHVAILRPKSDILDSRFLSYLLVARETKEQLLNIGEKAGATRQALTKEQLQTFRIPLPPLDEQNLIVAVLDQAFAALDRARAHAEANLADVSALLESRLHAAFEQSGADAGSLSFDQLCVAVTPKTKIKRQDYLEEGRYPVVSQEADKVSGYWNNREDVMRVEGPIVVFGDHTRCLKYIDFDFVVGADGTKVLKPNEGVSAAYLYYGLRSRHIEGGGYARHFKFLREKSLPDIPLSEQMALTDRLKEIECRCEDLTVAYEAKISDIANLRQSLLQKAFSGELT